MIARSSGENLGAYGYLQSSIMVMTVTGEGTARRLPVMCEQVAQEHSQ